jgi:hypothetical protein
MSIEAPPVPTPKIRKVASGPVNLLSQNSKRQLTPLVEVIAYGP